MVKSGEEVLWRKPKRRETERERERERAKRKGDCGAPYQEGEEVRQQ